MGNVFRDTFPKRRFSAIIFRIGDLEGIGHRSIGPSGRNPKLQGHAMPVYEYEHTEGVCELGQVFEWEQSMRSRPLHHCPRCAGPVKKIVSRIFVSCPKTNGELRDMGFTKLVKRDDGVYENVTARGADSRYMVRGKSDTIPDLSKTISD
jgi:predicted nucleic acid-binding Zn ribbon protein